MNTHKFMLSLAFVCLSAAVNGQTDVSSRILNAGFEGRGFGGWANKGFQTQTNNDFAVKTYKAYAEKWVPSGSHLADSRLVQRIANLENGQYRLTAQAQNIQNGAAATGGYLTANGQRTTVGTAGTYTVDFAVVDGTAEIGMELEACTGNWASVDGFQLSQLSTDVSYLRTGLNTLATEADALASQSMQSDVLATLTSAIANAKQYTANGSATNVSSAYTTLKKAMQTARNSIFYTRTLSGTGTAPTVVTDPRYQVGRTVAFGRSTVTGANIMEQGFCYSTTNQTPTVADDRTWRSLDHVGLIHILDYLEPGTTYYIRAYAVTTGYRVGYGEVLRIHTLPAGSITYNFNTSNDENIDARIRGAMDGLIGYWNQTTSITDFRPTANYNAGVGTADCSYGGWIRFGPNEDYQATGTAMHEALHGIGVGTDVTFSEHMEVYSGGPGSSWGTWLGKRAKQMAQFWDNSEGEYITGGGSHVWATHGENMTSYTINGAHEDSHTDLQYYGDGLLAQAMCEDGMCPVANQSFLPGYCFKHTDNTKYYIRNTNEKYGLNTPTYLYASGTTLKWKTYADDAAAAADNAAAWYIEFDPATQYYYFRNASTGKYLYSSGGNFDVSGTTKDANSRIHLHLAWWDAAFSSSTTTVKKDAYYLMHPSNSAYPASLTATASGNLTTSSYKAAEGQTAQRWMILTMDETDDIEEAVVAMEREKVKNIIGKVRKLAETPHTDLTGSANSTLASTLSDIESMLASATQAACKTYYNDAIAACKTFMLNTTPDGSGYDITFLIADPGFDSGKGWTGNPVLGYSGSEKYQTTFDIYQTLPNMLSGHYRLQMQAYERPGSSADVFTAYKSGSGDRPVTAEIYVGNASQGIANICEAAQTAKLNVGKEAEVTYNETTMYIPNDMQSGAAYFNKGLYDNAVDIEDFGGGALRFGIRNTSSVNYDWTMFDNVRLYYYGGEEGSVLLSEKDALEESGFAKITALPDDYSSYFFLLYDHVQDLALVLKNGVNQGKDNKTMWYQAGTEPRTDKTALWTLDAYSNGGTDYQIITNVSYPEYMLQTEWNAGWNIRTNDNGAGDMSWGQATFSLAQADAAEGWTIQNGRYPDAGFLGAWNNTITDGAEAAFNKTGENVGHLDIFSILRGEYVKRFDTTIKEASIDNPVDITYVLENAGGERRTTIGWTNEGTQFQTQVNNLLKGTVGSYYLECWKESGVGSADFYQQIQGLPDGDYRFSAIVHVGGTGEPYYLYANDEAKIAPTDNNGSRTEVVVHIADGNLRVGTRAENVKAKWIAFDDARLEYLGAAPLITPGDVCSDGELNMADVEALVCIILGKDNGDTPQYDHAAADVNCDGEVTIADLTRLVNLIIAP